MTCKQFNNLEGCGNCKVKLSNVDDIKDLTILSMSDVINIIMDFIIHNTDKKLELQLSIITCIGDIELIYSEDKDKNYIYKNKCTFKDFISGWYTYHKVLVYDALVLIHISKMVSILNIPMPDNELIKKAIDLNNAMNVLTINE